MGVGSPGDGPLRFGVEDHDVRIAALGNAALFRIHAEDSCSVAAELLRHLRHGHAPGLHSAGMDQRRAVLHTGAAVGYLCKIVLSQRLLRHGKGAVVRADHIDLVLRHGGKDGLRIRRLAQRRREHEPGPILRGIGGIIQHEILRAGFKIDLLPPQPRPPRFLKPLLCGQVYHPGRRLRQLRNAHQAGHRLRFDDVRPGQRVGRGPGQARRPALQNPLPEQIVVFTVYADDAVLRGSAPERVIDRAVVHAHGVVHHVHFKGSYALPDHGRDLADARVVPLRNRHVEPIVTAAALRLFVPQVEGVLHGHAAVLRCKIQHRGGAAQHRRPRAGNKVVRRDRRSQVEIEMGMRINKAGHDIAARSVDTDVVRLPNLRRDPQNGSVLRQHIRRNRAAVAHNQTVSDQDPHAVLPSILKIFLVAF